MGRMEGGRRRIWEFGEVLEVTDGEGIVGGGGRRGAPWEEESKYTKCARYDGLQDAEEGEGLD